MKDFDELLDGVLREDAAAQPRMGFEGRVMARVLEEERLPQGYILRLRSGWRSWLLMLAAASVGIVAVVWYVAAGGVSKPERIASRVSPPAFSAHSVAKPGMKSGGSGRVLGDAHLTIPPASWRGPRLSDDQAIVKMGQTALKSARYGGREIKRTSATSQDEPKLETFPAVSQKGDAVGWLSGGDGGKLAAIAREVSPETLTAYQQLLAAQSEPIKIAAIEIKPLQ